MDKMARGFLALAFSLSFPVSALAGIADSPLPVLVAGQTTLHLYSVPGLMDTQCQHSFFSCTSTDAAAMQVGVELFAGPGGPPVNDAAATSLSVNPGGSVILGTSPATAFSVNSVIGSTLNSSSSARILATSKKLACTAFVTDVCNSPPMFGWQLTIIKKATQKAAN